MILLDAIYINNSGGKILLDYLIETLEQDKVKVHYLLDDRTRNTHPIVNNQVTYLPANFIKRHQFYLRNKNSFSKVLCFGNIPPSVKLKSSTVYTYFHQKLFLEIPKEIKLKQKVVFLIKSFIFKSLQQNTDFLIVQTDAMAKKGKEKIFKKPIFIIPFYPSIPKTITVKRKKNVFVYISSGTPHKNHFMLLNGFCNFFNSQKIGELHLTVSLEFKSLYDYIENLKMNGYPIVNHGFVNRDSLGTIYGKAAFSIYPSLSESFGLGIIEAIENQCNIIGSDLPYTYAVCKPSLIFDPSEIKSIAMAFQLALEKNAQPTEQLVFNEIDRLVKLLQENEN